MSTLFIAESGDVSSKTEMSSVSADVNRDVETEGLGMGGSNANNYYTPLGNINDPHTYENFGNTSTFNN